jgi:NAD(P)-dependent dehydrogenase (short-subunit alcohol dehydrogenase family)
MKSILLGWSTVNSIILIISYDPSAEILDYATTKAAIVGFSKGLDSELLEKGIRVNAVAV